jgi:SEC-C motif-containing protein
MKLADLMDCPCGSGRPYDQCCAPFHRGAPAPTAEALMRSRYSAYALGEIDYLLATHDPSTAGDVDREATARWARESKWLGLQILSAERGAEGDEEGVVEFAARFRHGSEEATHLERSVFRRREGRWLYVEGSTPRRAPARKEARAAPNDPCPCGSGKKFKRCCGR